MTRAILYWRRFGFVALSKVAGKRLLRPLFAYAIGPVGRRLVGPILSRQFEKSRTGIQLYLKKKTFLPGEEIPVYVHSPERDYRLEIVHFGTHDAVVFEGQERPAKRQGTSPLAFRNGAGWEETDRLDTTSLAPGVYAIRGSDYQNISEAVFCMRPPGVEEKISILLNTNTWAAYNAWGGSSLYSNSFGFFFSEWASLLRPNPSESPALTTSHLFGGELHLIRWLHNNNLAFTCLTDSDLHNGGEVLGKSKVLILNTHPEYWSAAMYDHLEDFLNSGGSLLSLAGNGLWWKVEMGHTAVFVDKSRRVHNQGQWKNLGRPASSVLGSLYDGIGYGTFAPYEIVRADHWIFEGLNVRDGDSFGDLSLVTSDSDSSGASGWELDHVDEFSPANGLVVAKGQNPGGGADVFIYEHPGGGTVLSFGSISSASAVPLDSVMAGMVTNFLKYTSGAGK